MTNFELGVKMIKNCENLIQLYDMNKIFYYDEKAEQYYPRNNKMQKFLVQLDDIGAEAAKAENEGKTISLEAIIADIKSKPSELITEEEKDVIINGIHNGKYDVIEPTKELNPKPLAATNENEVIMEPVTHAPIPTYAPVGEIYTRAPETPKPPQGVVAIPMASAPIYIISAGKAEVKFPESNANLEKKVKDFFSSECILKSLVAKLADGEYPFKVLSGDAKVPLKLLCCLPDKEILLSYKVYSCDVSIVEI